MVKASILGVMEFFTYTSALSLLKGLEVYAISWIVLKAEATLYKHLSKLIGIFVGFPR